MQQIWRPVAARRGVLSVLAVLLAAVLAATLGLALGGGHTAQRAADTALPSPLPVTSTAGARPNIILISTDDEALTDMRWMPKTRRLMGQQGTTFTHMFSPHPLCCPARAEILTGEFAQNNGVHSNSGPYGGYPNLKDPDNTVGSWLQQRGYHTAMLGKFLNEWSPSTPIPDGWNYWQTSVKSSFGYYGYHMDLNGKEVSYPPSGPYSTDLVSNVTDKLIDQYSQNRQPFFIWSSYYAPHGLCDEQGSCRNPPEPAHRYAHFKVRGTPTSETKPSFDERDVRDKPIIIRRSQPVTKKFATYDFTQRIRSLQSVDDAVQRTFATLKKDGVAGNTYVLFTSDNGYLIGEHRYLGKILPYEEALRVPLYARGPGVARGATVDHPVTTVDLAATIADMAGATPAREQDGESLLPVLHGGPAPKRNSVLIQAGGLQAAQVQPWLYRGVRTDRYTFARYFQRNEYFNELYDDQRDPYQLNNLAYQPRYRRVVAVMLKHLKALETCKGQGCNRTFGALPAPAPPTRRNQVSHFPRPGGRSVRVG